MHIVKTIAGSLVWALCVPGPAVAQSPVVPAGSVTSVRVLPSAAAGAVVGSSGCWKSPCGDGHGPLLVAFGAGLGAGIGAGVGFSISLARH